ncbi:hypothetical protein [Enterobacter ludwigii]|uniref:tail fiber/spike domain-containing protein n=1 Tax=Enterobacter ludwigii TaxID=299767 RepID=UPI003ED9A5EB
MATQPTNLPVPSESPRDLKFNAGKIDEFVTSPNHTYADRFGNQHWTIAGINYTASLAISNYGYVVLDSFEDGNNLTLPNQVLRYEATGEYYRWDGELPKTVAPGSTPATSGGVGPGAWLSVGDATLRGQLASFSTPGTNLIGTKGGVNLTQYLDRVFMFIDDLPGVDKTGVLDSSAALNTAISNYTGTGVKLIGNASSTYRLESTISFIGFGRVDLDFNGATIIDNVQGYIPDAGNRGNHTFVVYNNTGPVRIGGFKYTTVSTRANSFDANGSSTCLFWIGGQYLGTLMTRDVELHDVSADGHAIYHGFVIANLGECDGLTVRRFLMKNGSWKFGMNPEYGRQPVDPSVDPTLNNGKHPYNIYVEDFHCENLPNMDAWLRVASSYNVKYFNCTAYNTPNFIVFYSGDRGITRYSQNVVFENCKCKNPGLTQANNNVWVIVTNKDGSTGEDLPSWSNQNFTVQFINCEFWNNHVLGSSGLRFMGNKGKTTFIGCIFKNSYYGVNAQPSTNPTYDSKNGLSFRDCIFMDNFQDVIIVGETGALFDHCTFKSGESTTLNPFEIGSGCQGLTIQNCLFDEILVSGLPYIKNASSDVTIENNTFYMKSGADYAITSTNRMFGSRNRPYGSSASVIASLTDSAVTAYRVIGDDSAPKLLSAVGASTVNFEISDFWNCNAASLSVSRIIGGRPGQVVTFRGTTGGASVAFLNSASGVSSDQRIVNKTLADQTMTGNNWSKSYKKMSDGWWEI